MVAARSDHRRGEPELGVPSVDADDAGEVLGRPVMDVETRSVGDLGQRLEGDVEPVARGVGAGRDEGVAAP